MGRCSTRFVALSACPHPVVLKLPCAAARVCHSSSSLARVAFCSHCDVTSHPIRPASVRRLVFADSGCLPVSLALALGNQWSVWHVAVCNKKNYIRPVFAARQGDVTADGINMEGSDAQEEQP